MARKILVTMSLAVAACGLIAAETATAKGLGPPPGGGGGVTMPGLPHRYAAMSPSAHGLAPTDPRNRDRLTLVTQTDRRGGRVSRWWHLPGFYALPGMAYDNTAGGLSADGRTLVLSRFSAIYPPRVSRFAILDTRVHLRHPVRPGEGWPRHAIQRVSLRGGFSFDAISPDGSTIYLIEHLSRNANVTAYRIRALDRESGRLLRRPIVDPDEPKERMAGLPISHTTSPDGRWAYTLYDGNGEEPFIHALDTVGRRAACVDLPHLTRGMSQLEVFQLRLRVDPQGRELTVLSQPPGMRGSRPLRVVDAESFEVRAASGEVDSAGVPWLAFAIGL